MSSPKFERTKVIEQAERLVKANKLAEAVSEYSKLLEGDIQDITISNIIGDLHVRLGQDEEAINSFKNVAGYYESRSLQSQALAIYKKIQKLAPDKVEVMIKLGDLFAQQGFVNEAKKEYARAEARLKREKKPKDLITVYEKLVSLDRENLESKIALADLYSSEGLTDQGVAQLNEASELLISRGELDKAEVVLKRARQLKDRDERTLANIVDILRKQDKRSEAIKVVHEFLDMNPDQIVFQNLLGTLYFEEKNFEKAEDIFTRILAGHPLDVKARITLGRIYVLQDDLDKAYELFDPLINNLLKKQKDDKAIGLLGIILSAKRIHLPSLERMATIYKARNDRENLEIIYRVILGESRERKLRDQMFLALSELIELAPKDEEVAKEYWSLRKELGFMDERKREVEIPDEEELETEDAVDSFIATADLYIQQGLIRNARRMLENLSHKFPDNQRINEKLAELEKSRTEISDDEIMLRVGKVSTLEPRFRGKSGRSFDSLFREDAGSDEKITSADIFAGTDILPLQAEESARKIYYDLSNKIQEEQEVIRSLFYQQLQGLGTSFEKDFTEIVAEFRKQAKEKIDFEDYDAHYQLGLAFLEQGLLDEAIEEFMTATQDDSKAFECCTMIGDAYRRKKDYAESQKWFGKCLEITDPGSEQLFALEYELATLYEAMGEKQRALNSYEKVSAWNSEYRDVSVRIKILSS
jgi:tetratricopeptide (TPR) repeat protein